MRFPSVAALSERARAVLFRFPWVLTSGAVASAAALVSMDRSGEGEEFWIRLCFTAMLAIPLTVALTLLAQVRRWDGWRKTGLIALGIVGLIWFLLTWPDPEQKHLMIRYIQVSAALHLLVSFLPFLGVAERSGFWQYNRRLFEGFLRAVLFSGVLFVGLAIALGALDKLFGVDIEGQTYLRLWFVIAFVVNTWIFLAGVPDDLEMEGDDSYPKALKVFTQYILTPLVAIYLVILTAYLVKILVTGTWPNGWIGYLVSSVAATGILGFLLVHPLRTHESEGWIRTYARWMFVGLIPAAIMFLLALWKRVQPYGFTELRFLGVLLGVWLLGLAIAYSVRRNQGIRIIPVSLAIILLLTAFGPMSATHVSIRSQASRIRTLLETHDAAVADGQASPLTIEDRAQMSDALRFMLERNDTKAVGKIFGARAGTIAPLPRPRGRLDLIDSTAMSVMRSAGLEYLHAYYYQPVDNFSLEPPSDGTALPIAGYDYVIRLSGNDTATVVLRADTLSVQYDSASRGLQLRRGGQDLLRFSLGSLADSIIDTEPGERSQLPLKLVTEGDSLRGLLVLGWISGEKRDEKVRIWSWRGDLYLGGKP